MKQKVYWIISMYILFTSCDRHFYIENDYCISEYRRAFRAAKKRGDSLSINNGQLMIYTKSMTNVPSHWFYQTWGPGRIFCWDQVDKIASYYKAQLRLPEDRQLNFPVQFSMKFLCPDGNAGASVCFDLRHNTGWGKAARLHTALKLYSEISQIDFYNAFYVDRNYITNKR